MINWNNPHKKMDISLIRKKIKDKLKKVVIGSVLVGTLLTYSGTATYALNENIEVDSSAIEFVDENFRKNVEEEFYYRDIEVINEDNLDIIQDLYLENVSSLDDLAMFSDLNTITIVDSNIDNLDILAKFPNLISLRLSNVTVNNICQNTLDNITTLVLLGNNVINYNDISKFPNLKKISIIQCNNLNNISFVNYLNYLEEVQLYDLNINDISALKNCPNLSSLDVSGLNNKDYSFLNNKKITNLSINETNINDFHFLETLTSLETLSLNTTNFSNAKYIKNCPIKYLNIYGTYISSLSDLPNTIEILEISACTRLDSLEGIKNLPNLNMLNIVDLEHLVNDGIMEYINNSNISFITNNLGANNYLGEINNIASSLITDDMDDFTKMRVISEYVINLMKYTYSKVGEDNKIKSSLEGEGICSHYSLLTQLLGRSAGLDIYQQYGTVNGIGHVWNTVKIEGNWYSLDTTWMDNSFVNENYYLSLITDSTNKNFSTHDFYGTPYNINFNNPYSDTNNENILKWTSYGVIGGDGTGKFNPDNYLTRAEMAQVMVNLFKLESTSDITFKDVDKDSWYYDAVSKCVDAGLIEGYNADSFGPDDYLTYEQIIIVMNRALKKEENMDPVTGNLTTGDKYRQNITRKELINYIDSTIDYYLINEGTYYLNGGTAIIANDNIKLLGITDKIILTEDVKNVNIDNLEVKELDNKIK